MSTMLDETIHAAKEMAREEILAAVEEAWAKTIVGHPVDRCEACKAHNYIVSAIEKARLT